VKVTVDINVLLDVFQKRQPFEAASAQVLSLAASSKLGAVIPAHGLTTLYYLVRKHSKKVNAERAMDRVLAHFEIGNLDSAGWIRARALPRSDFEDAVVAVVAETTGSRYIVTRNVDDFVQSPVPAITPADLVAFLALTP